jgi:APA family basic amino acid/polyamine antiporter
MAAEVRRAAPGLVRGLGQLDATMIIVGTLIGSGIFIVSAESARLVGAPGCLLATWLLAGVMTITGAQCCAELAAMMPCAGGQYVFLREAYGPGVAFGFGWAFFLIILTGKLAAVAIAFASFTGVLIEWVDLIKAWSSEPYWIAPATLQSAPGTLARPAASRAWGQP